MNEQQPRPCTACNGAGSATVIDFDAGVMTSRSQTCSACGGTGRSQS